MKSSPEIAGDTVDHAAAHHGLPDGRIASPSGAVREQVMDTNGEVVIGRQQAPASGDDSVLIVIGVASEGDIKLIL